jgi:aspartyl-tRNA(Asn)/glutamyl-tRNA(Gln) amidotransferase subunit B
MTDPLATSGHIDLSPRDPCVTRDFRVGIQQIQLEQDTAKTTRYGRGEGVRVDLNRAGVGLMEIVTDAHMRCAVFPHINMAAKPRRPRAMGSDFWILPPIQIARGGWCFHSQVASHSSPSERE